MSDKIKKYFLGSILSKTESLHEESRITLFYNLVLTVFFMSVLSVFISLIIGTLPVILPSLGHTALSLFALFSLRWCKSVKKPALVYFSALYLLLMGNLYFNDATAHIGTPFWIILLNIFVIYTLGIRWGIVFLLLSAIGFIYYLHAILPRIMHILPTLSSATYSSVYYETIFALFLLGYIINTILNSSKKSDELLKKRNEELIHQNQEIIDRDIEKTVLLKEIHHRVKNNLQVITSLLRLQMRELKHEESISKFRDSINRVLTMALIHEKIYKSEGLSKVNLEEYFRELSQDLIKSYQIDFQVQLNYLFEVEKIGLKSIVPLALIFNELFSNSLKHAFVSSTPPFLITLQLRNSDKGYFEFTYSDNGKWKPPGSDSTFGLELIDSLTDQLEGELSFQSSPETVYRFKIKHLKS